MKKACMVMLIVVFLCILSCMEKENYRRVAQMKKQVWKNNAWIDSIRTIVKYDLKGRLQSKISQRFADDKWLDDNKISFIYDENDNITTELTQVFNDENWDNSSRNSYSYNAGSMVEWFTEAWYKTKFVENTKKTFTYDGNLNLIEYVQESYSEEKWENDWRFKYFYANGKLESFQMHIWIDESWDYTDEFIYAFNEEGLRSGLKIREKKENLWDNSASFLIYYNDNGDDIEEIFRIWNGSEFENNERYLKVYDEEYVVESITQSWYDESWINSSRVIYDFESCQSVSENLDFIFNNGLFDFEVGEILYMKSIGIFN